MRNKWALMALIALVALVGCAKDKTPVPLQDPRSNSTIYNPVTIKLIPGTNGLNRSKRLFLPLMQIGSKPVQLRIVFDTGSEGVALDAKSILPPELVADTGIVLNHQDSLVVDGITVTPRKLATAYGIKGNSRSFHGNVAYASIKFGDADGNVTTKRMPFFLIYNGINDQTKKTEKIDLNSDGIGGVCSFGLPKNEPIKARSDLRSPFSFVSYGGSTHAGFLLSPLNVVDWPSYKDFNGTQGVPILTIGITDQSKTEFIVQRQQYLLGGKYSPNLVATISYPHHQIEGGLVLLDSGTPSSYIICDPNAPKDNLLTASEKINFSTAEGVSFTYETDQFPNRTQILKRSGYSVYGINFFMNTSFLLDYTKHEIGIKPDRKPAETLKSKV